MFTSKKDSFLLSFIKGFTMKTSLILTICYLVVIANCIAKTNDFQQTVNVVLGDISYFEKFGKQPTKNSIEKVRLQTHLEYVEQLLRKKDVSSLSEEQQQSRTKLLDILHEYTQAGVFPKNTKYSNQRKPCFIDKDGNICAVGYLIERTAGREVSENINKKYQYEYLQSMNDPIIDTWIQSSGLTKEECAMIQPMYGPPNYKIDNYISQEYGITSAMMSGANLSLNAINGIQIANGNKSPLISMLGLLSGSIQIVYGVNNYPSESGINGNYTYNLSQRDLSLVNIGLGTTTLILSTWNFITNKKFEENPSASWNLYSFPTQGNTSGVGLSFSKRLE